MKEKLVGLFSGGIDSPVAILLAPKNFRVMPVYFCPYPMTTQESSLLAFDGLKRLWEKRKFNKLYVLPWVFILKEIKDKVKNEYSCLACRKSMFKVAEKMCELEEAGGIVTGESIGQKASQTLENITTTSSNLSIPVLRPVIGMNKNEIIDLSRKFGIWREEHADTCRIVPKNPATKGKEHILSKEMEKISPWKKINENRYLILVEKDLDWDFKKYLSKIEEVL